MIKACVIGYPIKHSRSPLIHNHWLKEYGIHGHYERREVTPEELPRFLTSLPHSEYVGCNITLPHKEEAYELVSRPDDRAKRMGSINTVYIRDGKTHATSTDGEGFVENIRWRTDGYSFQGKKVMVLGAGGSARSIIYELLDRGVTKVILANRTLAKAETIAANLNGLIVPTTLAESADLLQHVDILINTTSAGISGNEPLEFPFSRIPSKVLVTDINYVPLITPFLQQAMARGLHTVTGLGMLLHQAVAGFELWFGRRPVVTQQLYDIVAHDIDSSYRP